MKKGKIVYSTNPDWQETCPVCDNSIEACTCSKGSSSALNSQTILIKREKKGRRGKTVTTIRGLKTDPEGMKKTLQQLCGSGGTYKNGIIEIQGDHREKIQTYLQKEGYEAKLAGG